MSTLNKQLQERIGELIGKDYFKLKKECKVKILTPDRYKEFADEEYTIGTTLIYAEINNGEDIEIKHIIWLDEWNEYCDISSYDECDFESTGIEPPIQDLLRALYQINIIRYKNGYLEYLIGCDGGIYTQEQVNDGAQNCISSIDLSLSLFSQSDEDKQKLLDLLK